MVRAGGSTVFICEGGARVPNYLTEMNAYPEGCVLHLRQACSCYVCCMNPSCSTCSPQSLTPLDPQTPSILTLLPEIEGLYWTKSSRGCFLGVRVKHGPTTNFIGFREKVRGAGGGKKRGVGGVKAGVFVWKGLCRIAVLWQGKLSKPLPATVHSLCTAAAAAAAVLVFFSMQET